jgi:hypothetical protein
MCRYNYNYSLPVFTINTVKRLGLYALLAVSAYEAAVIETP